VEEARKHGSYSDAICIIMKLLFSVNVNFFVKFVCIQRIKYDSIETALSLKGLVDIGCQFASLAVRVDAYL
jgi:hypothetical protein